MTKIKLKLTDEIPPFPSTVAIPIHGDGEQTVPVKFQFVHRTRDELKGWLESVKGKEDAAIIMEVAAGWDLDDAFTIENAELLCQKFAGAGRAIFDKYIDELSQHRTKN